MAMAENYSYRLAAAMSTEIRRQSRGGGGSVNWVGGWAGLLR